MVQRSIGVLGVLFCALTACNIGLMPTQKHLASAHDAGKGSERVFPATMDQTWEAARAAIRWNKVATVDEHRPDLWMSGLTAATWEDRQRMIGAWLAPAPDNATRVRVVVIDQQPEREARVLEAIDMAITLEKAGKPLPDMLPGAPQ